jgi:hypothetical protein
MAITKKYDIAVKTGSYLDRATGQNKNRYQNIGAVMQGDNGPFILLDPLVNLAAVPREDGKDRVICSLFEPRDSNAAPAAPAQRQAAPQRQQQPAMDDDIPF